MFASDRNLESKLILISFIQILCQYTVSREMAPPVSSGVDHGSPRIYQSPYMAQCEGQRCLQVSSSFSMGNTMFTYN